MTKNRGIYENENDFFDLCSHSTDRRDGCIRFDSNTSPERVLLESVISLQGEKVTQTQAQTELQNALKTYVAATTADAPEVRQQHLQGALIELGIYTPAQASAFVTQANAQAKKLGSNASAQAVVSEIQTLAKLAPQGAQFSACSALDPLALTSFGTFMVAWIAGASDYLDNDAIPQMMDVAYGAFGISIVSLVAALIADSSGNCDNY